MAKWVWVLTNDVDRKVLATNCRVGGVYIFFVSLMEVGGEWVYNGVLWKASDWHSYWSGSNCNTSICIGIVVGVWVVVDFIVIVELTSLILLQHTIGLLIVERCVLQSKKVLQFFARTVERVKSMAQSGINIQIGSLKTKMAK